MFQKNETCKALKECYLMSNIPKRNLASGCHLKKKKKDQPSWRTTRRNYKHMPQIVCISRFRVLRLLSWEFEQSEVLWRYTVIFVCHLKYVEVGWSTRNYPHTGLLPRRCALSRWRDVVFLHEVSIGRPKEDEKWTFGSRIKIWTKTYYREHCGKERCFRTITDGIWKERNLFSCCHDKGIPVFFWSLSPPSYNYVSMMF